MKLLKKLLPILILTCFISSCINNKKIVYLQDKSQPQAHDFLNDTVFDARPVDYILEENDIVYVKTSHASLTQSYQQSSIEEWNEARNLQSLPHLVGFTVDPEGNIDLPTIGKVNIGGKTIFEAQETIREKATSYFSDPSIKIYLLNYYVTILGEVNNPGRYPVFNNRINVLEAIGMANDAMEYANREEIRIVRNRNGVNKIFPVDLTDQNLLSSPGYYLQPNDIVIVKQQKRKKYASRDIQNVFNAIGAAVSLVTLYLLIER